MKAFVCKQVWVNGDLKWVVQVAEDAGDYEAVEPLHFYDRKDECEMFRDRLDYAENGKP